MKTNVIFTATMIFLLAACSDEAPGSLINQYRQMGSVAGTAEKCYGSKSIIEALKPKIQELQKSGTQKKVLQRLANEYDESYAEGIKNQVIWNGTQGKYSSPFNCSSEKDMQLLRNSESLLIEVIQQY